MSDGDWLTAWSPIIVPLRQVFSLSHGSVHDELNMKARKSKTSGGTGEWTSSLVKVNEEGAVFRSYINGTLSRT